MPPTVLDHQRLERLLDITRDLTATVSQDQLLYKIASAAAELTNTEMAGILLFDEPSGELWFMTATHLADQLQAIPVPIHTSIAGAAFTSRAPVMVPAVNADPRYYRGVEAITGVVAHSLLALPLLFQDQCIGVLEIENKRDGANFDQQDVDTLYVLAAQAASAIQNARLIDSLNRERQRAESFRRVSMALNSSLNYNEVLEYILNQISEVIPGDAANIMMLEGDGRTARVVLGRGYGQFGTADTLTSTTIDLNQARLLRQMQVTRQPLTIADVARHPDWVYSRPEHTWIKSYVGAPIIIQEHVVGFLSVLGTRVGQFGPINAEYLQTFSLHAASALANALLYQKVQLDLARHIKTEAELSRHRDNLTELVDERVAEIQQINAELREQNAELDAFAHTVAHDLKNPLTSMIGFAQILADELSDTPDEIAQECLTHLQNGGRQMTRIIDELLLLASVRRKADLALERLEMAAIVNNVQTHLSHLIEEYHADIRVPLAWPAALGKAAWVEEVWANYLSNAIKYGGRPPQIELGATVLDGENVVRCWVRDNGHGIAPHNQARLFTEFTRLHQQHSPHTKGHGLGLSIVRRIVERLGGQVGVESEPGCGSVFYFTLPGVP